MGKGVRVTLNNIPYDTYRVYGLFTSDQNQTTGSCIIRNFNVNGTWALGGTATTTAPAWGTINANLTNTGSFWTRIFRGSVQGNYWVVDSTGTTCSIVGETRSGSNRGSLTAVIIEDTSPPAASNPPIWDNHPISKASGAEGVAYSSTLADRASDPDAGDVLIFSKISGPAWLNVSSNGELTGTPTSGDIGTNQWTVRVADGGGLQADATLNILIAAAPGVPSGLTAVPGNAVVELSWDVETNADGYALRRATTSGGPYTLLSGNLATNSFTDYAVNNGITYYYAISSIGPAGESALSSEISATPLSEIQAWRLANFGSFENSGDAHDDADPDGDGATNAEEFKFGTDPNDRTSVLAISAIVRSNSDALISFSSVSGRIYRIEWSDSLQPGSWTAVLTNNIPQENLPGTGSLIQIIDSNGSTQSRRFYRIGVASP